MSSEDAKVRLTLVTVKSKLKSTYAFEFIFFTFTNTKKVKFLPEVNDLKKILITLGITGLIVFGLLYANDLRMSAIEQVEVYIVKETGIISSVTSNAKIEEVHKKELYVELPARVQEIKVKEGDRVKQGQPLLELDIQDLKLELEQAKATMEMEKLYLKQALNSKGSLDQRQPEVPFGAQSVWNEQNLTDFSQQNTIAVQQKKLEIARLKVEELEKKIQRQSKVLESPIDGIVTCLNVSKGSVAGTLQPIITVSDLSELQAKASIGEYYISKIREGQEAEITGDAFDGTTYHGIVSHISPVAIQVMTGQRSDTFVEVIVDVTDEDVRLKPGYSANVKIITDTKDEALIVPYEAVVQDENNNDIVYVYKNGIAHKRKVITGTELDLETEIVRGLQKGEKVILNPSKKIKDGVRVKIKNIMP